MRPIDALEIARGGEFRYIHQGETLTGPDPTEMYWEDVIAAIGAHHMPGTPRTMALWKSRVLAAWWVAHYDLPDFDHARRLAFIVNKYRAEVEYDLQDHLGVEFAPLWHQRRWRTLLNYIDRIPYGYYPAAVANDPEHAARIAEQLADEPETPNPARPPEGPPLHTWSPLRDQIADLIDDVKNLNHTLMAVNSEKGKSPPSPKWYVRPMSALARARKAAKHDARLAKHKALAARLLPHKAERAD